ncbi:MAG: hypothetical protein ACRD0V_16420 [Acidimicrobiales bacterium]
MTHRDDRSSDMVSSDQFDAAIEQVLHGEAVGDDVASLARFVDDVRVMAAGLPPPPSPELAELLAGSTVNSVAPVAVTPLAPRSRSRAQARSRSGRSRAAELRLRVAASGLAAKAAVSLAFAGAVAAGGAAGILPEPATHFVRRALEVVTPFELPDDDTDHHGRTAHPRVNAAATPGGTAREAAVIDIRSVDVELHSDADAPRLVNPTGDTSTWVRSYPKKGTSPTQGPKPATPPSAPPKSNDPAKAPSPHGGPPTKPKPGPQQDHVPPGRPTSKDPHPGNSHSGGPPAEDRGPAEDRSKPSESNGPRSGPGSPADPPAGDDGQRPHGGPPPSVDPGEGPHDGPPLCQASPCDPSVRGGADHALVVPGDEAD